MYKLDELLERIEVNCKHKFGVHQFWVLARAALLAYRNGKYNMANNVNRKLYKKVIMDKEIVDGTMTFNMFIHDLDEKLRSKKRLT